MRTAHATRSRSHSGMNRLCITRPARASTVSVRGRTRKHLAALAAMSMMFATRECGAEPRGAATNTDRRPALIATNAPESPPTLAYQPQVDRLLYAGGLLGARIYLSFANGQVVNERIAEDPERDRRLHRDLKLDLTPGHEAWTGIGLELTPAADELWNAPPDRLISTLADNLAAAPPSLPVTPGLWLMRTQDGVYGLLRVDGFVEVRPGERGMKVTYKLAQPIR